jgi:SRSO17 transposase
MITAGVAAAAMGQAQAAYAKLTELMGALAGCFARVEPRRAACAYVRGLVADLPRKDCWMLAQHAGDATPDKMQRLLERARWDAGAAMRTVRDFAVAGLGEQDAVVVLLRETEVFGLISAPGVRRGGSSASGRQRTHGRSRGTS